MAEVSNDVLYTVLLELKEDMGAVKKSGELQLEGLKSHHSRISFLEASSQRQKGAVKVWGLIATAAATVAGGAIQLLTAKH